MKNRFEKLLTEDWVVVWVSVPLLLLAALASRRGLDDVGRELDVAGRVSDADPAG